MEKEYAFDTFDEYENYIDLLYKLIESRMEFNKKNLEEIEFYTGIKCENCYKQIRQTNPKYYQVDARMKAYNDCLTFFTYAENKTQRDKNIVRKILENKI